MSKPRILIYDVETSPVRVWTFRTGPKVNISHDHICEGERFDIICICYKWFGEKRVHSLDWGINDQNSGPMIEAFSKVVEMADLVIAHNGDGFDIKQINTQRLLHEQEPIDWPTSEDTLKQFRKYFYFPSNKLDYLAKTLAGGGKDKMTMQDWINIVDKKDPKSLSKMIKYCKRDVTLLEGVFKRAMPFFKAKIHAGLTMRPETDACPRCGRDALHYHGIRVYRYGRVARFRCQSCGAVSQARIGKNGNLGKIH